MKLNVDELLVKALGENVEGNFEHLALLVAALVGESVQCMDAILHHLFDLWYTFFRSSPTFFQEYAL
jgi:hypothetical protein